MTVLVGILAVVGTGIYVGLISGGVIHLPGGVDALIVVAGLAIFMWGLARQ